MGKKATRDGANERAPTHKEKTSAGPTFFFFTLFFFFFFQYLLRARTTTTAVNKTAVREARLSSVRTPFVRLLYGSVLIRTILMH